MARKRPELKARAAALKDRFDRGFWIPDGRFVAQAIDGGKRRVDAITSNPGHCLWAGILTDAAAHGVAERLVSPELVSGWGIRTLSTRAINYDPHSYHNRSVWPPHHAIAAARLRASGVPPPAGVLARPPPRAGGCGPPTQPAAR